MARAHDYLPVEDHVIVVGAGIAGLAAAARLAHAGVSVTVLERHAAPGGKLRTLPSPAGPVDAGPTVLTMRPVFEELFSALDERLDDHLTLVRQSVIARHFWPDGSRLDLHDDPAANVLAIREFAGETAASEFSRLDKRARQLFDAFEKPVMQAPNPSVPRLAGEIIRNPALLARMAPLSTLNSLLRCSFSDPRLTQLFGRYATYVGGSPYESPALLSLIWTAESDGVWAVDGGLHKLADAITALATARGASFRYESHVERIDLRDGAVCGVTLADGERLAAGQILFNGDPRALALGALGPQCEEVVPHLRAAPRALSAEVWAFAARARGPDLIHHNVFFRDDPKPEFDALAKGRISPTPTLYVCAMDRGIGPAPAGTERFEIIANAPPLDRQPKTPEVSECQSRVFGTLAAFGLTFDPPPEASSLTTPGMYNSLFPHSEGSLYGQSPHGIMSAFKRPTARTKVPGLYLAGGGVHPGAGMPMATLSARHAAAAILSDRTSTSRFRRTDMPGGTSTASATTRPAPSASSAS